MKFTVITTFILLFASRACNIVHPLILKAIIETIMCEESTLKEGETCGTTQDTYILIGFYALTKFIADVLRYVTELPFSYIAANAEKHIAKLVYSHIQNQSLAFHLSRETGKIIRIVSKGSQSFAQVMRYSVFNIAPMMIEITFVIATIGTLYPQRYLWLNLGAIVIYLLATILVTEWRAKYFKNMTKRDAEYVQRATDSLLNFETVKYFNAEDHEQARFQVSLAAYKEANVVVATTLVSLNMSQAVVLSGGLVTTLLLAYRDIQAGGMDVSDFVVFNTYIL